MAFSEETKKDALKRAENQCECKRATHADMHKSRCTNTNKLEFHHIVSLDAHGSDYLSNCEVLCHDCHVRTETYGD